MSELKTIDARTVLIADLTANLEVSIRAAISYYSDVYGIPKRIWVNPKDVPEELIQIDGWKIEHRGGCARGKVMVM